MGEGDRLKLRADASFVAVEGGVLLRNASGSYTVQGKGAYDLVRYLFMRLDGRWSGAELCAGLSANLRPAVERQLAVLIERGFIRIVRPDAAPAPDWAKRLYGEPLDYLAEIVDDPWPAFLRFRQTRFACVGNGVGLMSLLRQLAAYGVGDVRVAPADGETAIDEVLAELGARDTLARFVRVDTGALAHIDVDVLLVVLDRCEPERAARLVERTRLAGRSAGVVMPMGGSIVGVPLLDPASCWECVYRSLVLDGDADIVPASRVAIGLACNHMAHMVFLDRTGAGMAAETGAVALVESDRFVLRVHPHPARHPLCGQHPPAGLRQLHGGQDRPIRPDMSRSTDPPEVTQWQDTISDRTMSLVDPALGPLIAVGEQRLDQLPLSGSRCVARRVASMPRRPALLAVTCRGLSARETRNQVVLFAVERLTRDVIGDNDAAVGAGWSVEEAQYRALVEAGLSWARTGFVSSPAPMPPDALEPFSAYFAAQAAIMVPVCTYGLSPGGLVIARLEDGEFGAGPDAAAARANALAMRACIGRAETAGEEVVPALLTLRGGGWTALVAEAARHSVTPHAFLDAGDMMPAFAHAIHIALLRTVAE